MNARVDACRRHVQSSHTNSKTSRDQNATKCVSITQIHTYEKRLGVRICAYLDLMTIDRLMYRMMFVSVQISKSTRHHAPNMLSKTRPRMEHLARLQWYAFRLSLVYTCRTPAPVMLASYHSAWPTIDRTTHLIMACSHTRQPLS